MKLSVAIKVWDETQEPMFKVPKGFKFVYYNHTLHSKIYYRWPVNLLVKLYIKVYYWLMVKTYVKSKRTPVSRRKQKTV